MVNKGDVIQIYEQHDWTGCLALVVDVKGWGCVASVRIPNKGDAYIRLKKDEFYRIGRAELIPSDLYEEEE